jgi:hypothetical protein
VFEYGRAPHVEVGARYRMDKGEIEVDSITPIGFPDITPELARESGFLGLIDLLKVAKHGKGENRRGCGALPGRVLVRHGVEGSPNLVPRDRSANPAFQNHQLLPQGDNFKAQIMTRSNKASQPCERTPNQPKHESVLIARLEGAR